MPCEGSNVYPGCPQSSSLTIVMLAGLIIFGSLRTCFGSRCVSNCNSKPDGNYQACNTCTKFVSCSAIGLTLMDCGTNTVFDDNTKQCGHESETCPEPAITTTTIPQTTTTPMPITTSEETTTSFDQMTTAQEDTSTSSSTDMSGTNLAVTTTNEVMTTSGTALSPVTHTTSQSALSSTMTSTDVSQLTTLGQSNSTTIGYCGTGKCYTKVTFSGGSCTGSPSIILGTRFARSRLQCGSLCAAHQQCWFFSITGGQCTLYSGTTPPCGEIYQHRI